MVFDCFWFNFPDCLRQYFFSDIARMAEHEAEELNFPPVGGAEEMKADSIDSEDVKAEDNTLPIAVAVMVGLLTILLLYLYTRRRSLGRGGRLDCE